MSDSESSKKAEVLGSITKAITSASRWGVLALGITAMLGVAIAGFWFLDMQSSPSRKPISNPYVMEYVIGIVAIVVAGVVVIAVFTRPGRVVQESAQAPKLAELLSFLSGMMGGSRTGTPNDLWGFFLGNAVRQISTLVEKASSDGIVESTAYTVLACIRDCTTHANLIVSCDFELASWTNILDRSDEENAQRVLNHIQLDKLDHITSDNDRRVNSFFNIWDTQFSRLQNSNDHVHIRRTFVVKGKYLTWQEWAILFKFENLKPNNRNTIVTKILFRDEVDKQLTDEIKQTQDVIIFHKGQSTQNLGEAGIPNFEKLQNGSLCEIRETLDSKDREAFFVTNPTRIETDLQYAKKLFDKGIALNSSQLVLRVRIRDEVMQDRAKNS